MGNRSTISEDIDIINDDLLLFRYLSQVPDLVTSINPFLNIQVNVEILDQFAKDIWGASDRSIFDRLHIRAKKDVTEVFLTERSYNVYDDIDDLRGDNAHVDVYVGNQEDDNIIHGTRGNDLIFGGSGEDILYTNGGIDYLVGLEGSDTIVFTGGISPDLDAMITESVSRTAIGKDVSEDASLLDAFLRYFIGVNENADIEQDQVLFSSGSLDGTVVENGFEVTGLELDTSGDQEQIKLTTREFGASDNPETTDTLIGIDRTKFTWRRDVVNVTDASLLAPILLDLGGFKPGEVLSDDYDEVDYSQLSQGITYVNGSTRSAEERGELPTTFFGALAEIGSLFPYFFGATPDFLAFGDQRENDALRITGAEKITATEHDDTLWFGQVGFLQSLLSGWPADLGASPYGEIDAGDGNDLVVFTNPDVALIDDIIPEEFGGAAQTPNADTGELEGGSIAAELLRLTIDGGAGDDRILVRGGTGAITVGGEGRDFIFNTSFSGQIYGDTLDGLDADGNELNHEGLENSDVFWFWPGTFIQDAQPNDILQIFGLPLVGGSNSIAGIPAGDGGLAIDFFNWTTFYGTSNSGQLLVYNAIADLILNGANNSLGSIFGDGSGDILQSVQVVENYRFGGFSNEQFGRVAPGDLGLTFRIFLPRDRADEGITISLFNAAWGSVFTYIDVAFNLAKLLCFVFIPPQTSRKYCY